MKNTAYEDAIVLLSALINTPSFSGEEGETAALICSWLKEKQIEYKQLKNNVWAKNKHFDPKKPTILLNSHHDTVKPNKGYTRDPFESTLEGGRLFGLGSNDAGGCLVALMATFNHFYDRADLAYNLIYAASAEEENSGQHGISLLLTALPKVEFAIVGEPTAMHMAVAEKGLLVIDSYAAGISGHAAHSNTENAIYNALEDIQWVKSFSFPNTSSTLGEVKMNVTQIEAGKQHNVVPATCHFVIDVRINEHYTNQEVFETIDKHTKSTLKARSFRLNSSSIDPHHAIVQAGKKLGCLPFGSPTLSDQALMPFPSVKIGPGDTKRSHTADEYILVEEIQEGISTYVQLLNTIL
jgi:acetylornithine deacetylase